MPKVRFKEVVEEIQGTMYDVVFKKSPKGKTIVTKKPDMTKVKWSQAQKDHRRDMSKANDYAHAAMANPEVRAVYEEIAAKDNRVPYRVAMSDYFKGRNLLSQKGRQQGPVGSENPDEVLVREARPKDVGSIVRLIQQMGSDSPITADYVSSYLKSPRSRVLLAERQGRVAGLISYSVRPDLYHAGNSVLIEELVVDEACRGEGIGSALMTSLMEELKELNCREVCLAVMPDNEPAIRFYRWRGLAEEALFLERHFV